MGNSLSIKLFDFHDRILSICLWKLRKHEIVKEYLKNSQYHISPIQKHIRDQIKSLPDTLPDSKIPLLYSRHISGKYHQSRNSIIKYNKAVQKAIENVDMKYIVSNMISRYLDQLLQEPKEVTKLMNDILILLDVNNIVDFDMSNFNADNFNMNGFPTKEEKKGDSDEEYYDVEL